MIRAEEEHRPATLDSIAWPLQVWFMKIGAFQFDIAHRNPEENMRRILNGTLQLDVDLLVLPELCTSGYLLSPSEARELAVTLPGKGADPFVEIAQRLKCWVVAGVIEQDGELLYNSTLIVGPNGWIGHQRKLHTTRLEQQIFASGSTFKTFTLGPACIGVVTCFDAWFPEISRGLTRDGAQILCQPAAFGGSRTLDVMRVRSMENRVFSVTSNRLGKESHAGLDVEFCGRSQIVDCDGAVLASAHETAENLVVDVDLAQANSKANAMCADLSAEWNRYYPNSARPLEQRICPLETRRVRHF